MEFHEIMKKGIIYFILAVLTAILSLSKVSDATAYISIMPLGDSITHGSSSGGKIGEEVSYRKALQDKLIAAGYEFVFVGSQKPESSAAANLNHEGHDGWCAAGCYQNRSDILREVDNLLASNSPDVVLLHIGTNDIASHHRPEMTVSAVSKILDKIFRYGREQKRAMWVILALIINGQNPPCIYCQQITAYNKALRQMAHARIQKGEKIILVDMEKDAGLDYRLYPVGDMWDSLHPYETGYEKMAAVWFEGLKQILIPSRNILYQELRVNRSGGMRYFEGEKADPSPVLTAQTSIPPILSSPNPAAKSHEISGKESESICGSNDKPKEEFRASGENAAHSENKASKNGESKIYTIQLKAFRDLNNAERFLKTQIKRGEKVYLSKSEDNDQRVWYKIYMGHFADREEAVRKMKEMNTKENHPESFIKKLP